MTARGARWVALVALLAGPALTSAQAPSPARLTLGAIDAARRRAGELVRWES